MQTRSAIAITFGISILGLFSCKVRHEASSSSKSIEASGLEPGVTDVLFQDPQQPLLCWNRCERSVKTGTTASVTCTLSGFVVTERVQQPPLGLSPEAKALWAGLVKQIESPEPLPQPLVLTSRSQPEAEVIQAIKNATQPLAAEQKACGNAPDVAPETAVTPTPPVKTEFWNYKLSFRSGTVLAGDANRRGLYDLKIQARRDFGPDKDQSIWSPVLFYDDAGLEITDFYYTQWIDLGDGRRLNKGLVRLEGAVYCLAATTQSNQQVPNPKTCYEVGPVPYQAAAQMTALLTARVAGVVLSYYP